MKMSTNQEVEIDDSLYSRQRYVLGDSAMKMMAKANVLIVGLGGTGIEVAKNVILAGVKSVTLYDKNVCEPRDLGVQFFIKQADIDNELTRAEASSKRLAELNPYVSINVMNENIFEQLTLLNQFQCVVVTEVLFDDQLPLNEYCRRQIPTIPFISCDVHGMFSYIFCDFGECFQVNDTDGEEGKEILIRSITKANPCTVTTLDYQRHDLQSGDCVSFKELRGMEELHANTYEITYIDPFTFSINCDTTPHKYSNHEFGGIFKKTKKSVTVKFHSLEKQLLNPDVIINDLSKFDSPIQNFISLRALHKTLKSSAVTLNADDNSVNLDELKVTSEEINNKLVEKVNNLDLKVIEALHRTYQGKLSSLCASIGGIVAQEILKAISGKFTPLQQWLLIDAIELACTNDNKAKNITNNRYFHINHCLDSNLISTLHSSKLFMVGCGAIGCEMMKNISLLGIGRNGLISITDHDLIEKSNLNRQFLFRPWHVQKAKSTTAAQASKEINQDISIKALSYKVSPETESIFHDDFYGEQDIVVNALDNVAARKYIDGKCVSNLKPLIETGTMGPKGHVQVIVPHVTESYSNQQDPIDKDVPYCTLKSFPQSIEHTIQWARDKFEDLFNIKPNNYNKFWIEYKTPSNLLQVVDVTNIPDGFIEAVRLMEKTPASWKECIQQARNKFEVYFNHKALQLLHAFPLDAKLEDGSWFWQSPKRPPTPVVFSDKCDTHMQFIKSYAQLLAVRHTILYTKQELSEEHIISVLQSVTVKLFQPSSKEIVVDDSKTSKDVSTPVDQQGDKIEECFKFLKNFNSTKEVKDDYGTLNVEHFEKDDDSNCHIDFITSASNLRAQMYSIEPADRFETKRIAGRIIPAIATTTAAIAGLATIELLKVLSNHPIDNLKNCFLNLALPVMILSEPGQPPKTKVNDDIEFSSWDRWDVHGHKDYKLKDFMQYFKEKYSLTICMVCEGVKMIYVPFMPGHAKRVDHLMSKLLKPSKERKYSDLIISFESTNKDDDEDLPAPPVRYYYNL